MASKDMHGLAGVHSQPHGIHKLIIQRHNMLLPPIFVNENLVLLLLSALAWLHMPLGFLLPQAKFQDQLALQEVFETQSTAFLRLNISTEMFARGHTNDRYMASRGMLPLSLAFELSVNRRTEGQRRHTGRGKQGNTSRAAG